MDAWESEAEILSEVSGFACESIGSRVGIFHFALSCH